MPAKSFSRVLNLSKDTWFIYFVTAVSIIAFLVILFDAVPGLRQMGEWVWYLLPWTDAARIAAVFGSLGLFLIAWYILGSRLKPGVSHARIWASLGCLFFLSLIIQIAILAVFRINPTVTLFDRSASPMAGGYFTEAVHIENAGEFLHDFPVLVRNINSGHAQTKPPGILMIYWGVVQLAKSTSVAVSTGSWYRSMSYLNDWLADFPDSALAANAVVSHLVPILSAAVVFPAFGFARRRYGELAGWIAAALVLLIPGRLVFQPSMDTAYIFLAVSALFLLDTGIIKDQISWIFLSGLLLSIATFLSPVNFVVVGLLSIYIFLMYVSSYRSAIEIRSVLYRLGILIAGTSIVWVLYWFLFDVSPIEIIETTLGYHMEVERTYWFWLIAGPVEFAIFCGLPALIIMASWPFLKRHSEIPLSVSALAAAFVIIFLFLDISGIIRGEVGRIWMMLAPFPSLLVGAWLAYVTFDPELQEANRNRSLLRGGSAILLSTALFTAAIGLRWHVIIMEWNL